MRSMDTMLLHEAWIKHSWEYYERQAYNIYWNNNIRINFTYGVDKIVTDKTHTDYTSSYMRGRILLDY